MGRKELNVRLNIETKISDTPTPVVDVKSTGKCSADVVITLSSSSRHKHSLQTEAYPAKK